MKYICLIICLILTLYQEYPGLCLDRKEVAVEKEEIVEIKGIVGEFEILPNSSGLSHKECMLKAREDARSRAIDTVSTTIVTKTSSIEITPSGEKYNEITISSTEAECVDMKIRKEWMEEIEGSKVVVYYCLADVKVKKGKKPDPAFHATVKGIKNSYIDGDIMSFSLSPSMDCWMNIFLLEDDGTGYLIYPNRLDESVQLKENTVISFPQKMNFRIQYESADEIESNTLVIVLTKTRRTYAGTLETSRGEIEKWITMIPNDEKFQHRKIFNIVKK